MVCGTLVRYRTCYDEGVLQRLGPAFHASALPDLPAYPDSETSDERVIVARWTRERRTFVGWVAQGVCANTSRAGVRCQGDNKRLVRRRSSLQERFDGRPCGFSNDIGHGCGRAPPKSNEEGSAAAGDHFRPRASGPHALLSSLCGPPDISMIGSTGMQCTPSPGQSGRPPSSSLQHFAARPEDRWCSDAKAVDAAPATLYHQTAGDQHKGELHARRSSPRRKPSSWVCALCFNPPISWLQE
ncbi:hypothetical protein Q7P37_009142 [Cladosporium fusiforme]